MIGEKKYPSAGSRHLNPRDSIFYQFDLFLDSTVVHTQSCLWVEGVGRRRDMADAFFLYIFSKGFGD